jgi:glycosyltransferase involved in cell wall biosynthesis
MIVKNEDKFLKDCLESIREIASQIVIVDTGSTDGTRQIAEAFGAEIYDFAWNDDFSAARNESIKYAKGDWILWLDADERLLPESKAELLSLLRHEPDPVAYIINIQNLLPDRKNYKLSSAHRLFINHKGIYFTGRIHEQVSNSLSLLRGGERECSVTLLHLGYALDEEGQRVKNIRNRRLLERMVHEYPQNAYAHFTMAQHYGLTGLPQKALHHYKQAYRLNRFNPGMKASLLNTMAEVYFMMDNFEKAAANCRQSIEIIRDQIGAYYLLYRIADKTGRLEESIQWMEQVYEQTERMRTTSKRISTDVLIDRDQLLFTLGSLYLRVGNLGKAEELLKQIKDQRDRRVQEKLLPIYLQHNRLDAAQDILESLTSQLSCDPRFRDMLGTLLIKKQLFREALSVYEALHAQYPGNEQIVRRMAGLCAKTGDAGRAQELLSAFVRAS